MKSSDLDAIRDLYRSAYDKTPPDFELGLLLEDFPSHTVMELASALAVVKRRQQTRGLPKYCEIAAVLSDFGADTSDSYSRVRATLSDPVKLRRRDDRERARRFAMADEVIAASRAGRLEAYSQRLNRQASEVTEDAPENLFDTLKSITADLEESWSTTC